MLTALFVLMAISFVFTYLIVVRPVDFFTNQKQNNNVATTQDTGVQVRATYTTEDVFRPTRMVLTNKNKFEMTSSASIMKEVNAHLNKQFTKMSSYVKPEFRFYLMDCIHLELWTDSLMEIWTT